MSETSEILSDAPSANPPALPGEALEALAARLRPGGLFLVGLNSEGAVTFHDSAAGLFFQRYVLPMLQWREMLDPAFRTQLTSITMTSGVVVWDFVPGVTIAAFPYVQNRQLMGTLLLAAKSPGFRLSEGVVSVCSKLGVDGIWLSQQAENVLAVDREAIERQASLALSMVRDQVRLSNMEGELNSLSSQLTNTYEELSLIYALSSGMRINRSPSEFFKQACLDVMELIGVRGMGVALKMESASQPAVLYGSMGLPPGQVHRLSEELMGVLAQRKSSMLINDIRQDGTFKWLGEYAQQLLAVPLVRQDQVLGCLFALDKLEGEFDSVDSKLLTSIANESAIYLENTILYDDVRSLLMGLLHSLVNAVDAKDTYTCGHSERVALLSRTLARAAGLGDAVTDRIYMAGLLHDVGKIGVPEAVLQKTGRLTPEEFEQIKKHPDIGSRILKDIKQIEDIIPGVLHHHERFDGKGYPAGLSGESIPMMGRVICLADCFDAMTSSRTYRRAMPLEAALAEIRRCAGTQFDPVLTDAFLAIGADRFREILMDHKRQSKPLLELQQALRAA